jgi:hypothetical protein
MWRPTSVLVTAGLATSPAAVLCITGHPDIPVKGAWMSSIEDHCRRSRRPGRKARGTGRCCSQLAGSGRSNRSGGAATHLICFERGQPAVVRQPRRAPLGPPARGGAHRAPYGCNLPHRRLHPAERSVGDLRCAGADAAATTRAGVPRLLRRGTRGRGPLPATDRQPGGGCCDRRLPRLHGPRGPRRVGPGAPFADAAGGARGSARQPIARLRLPMARRTSSGGESSRLDASHLHHACTGAADATSAPWRAS